MTGHIATGKKGELLAACWLATRGYQILFRNWRYRHGEIDIIASKLGVLHFIEIKTSRNTKFGYPEERINGRKWKTMFKASDSFLQGWQGELQIQFDILSILIENGTIGYHFIEDAFPAEIYPKVGHFI